MKKVITGVLAFLMAIASSAQQRLDVSERWLMNERLLDLASTYERSSRFAARSDHYTFLSLFRSPDVPVYCDYMASAEFGESIPASRYVELSREMEDRSVQIGRFKKGPFEYRDGRWHVRLEFDKRIEYEDSLGFVFSTVSPLAGGDFHIAVDCVWMRDDEEFRIEGISGSESPGFSFPRGNFHIVQQKNEIDTRVLYGGQPLSFNEYGFTVLQDGGTFEFDDDDYVLSTNVSPGSGRYDIYSFSVKAKKFRVRPRASFTFNPLKVTTLYGAPTSYAVEAGVDFGYALSLGRSFKLVLYPGIGVSRSWFDMNVTQATGEKDISYSYLDRPYAFSAKENFSFTDFTISGIASFEFNLSRQLTMVVDAGLKTYLNLSAQDKYDISFTSPEDVNLLEGYQNPNEIPLGPKTGEPNFWVLSFVAKAGVDFAVSTGVYAFLHAGIEMGLGSDTGGLRKVVYSNPSAKTWYDAESGIYPVVNRMNGEKVEDIRMHSFKNSITSIERGLGIPVELGVRLKF